MSLGTTLPITQPTGDMMTTYECRGIPSRGGIVIVDTDYGEVATGIWISAANMGDVIFQTLDGKYVYFPDISGTFLFKHRKIVSTVTINNVVYETTAALITWFGGQR